MTYVRLTNISTLVHNHIDSSIKVTAHHRGACLHGERWKGVPLGTIGKEGGRLTALGIFYKKLTTTKLQHHQKSPNIASIYKFLAKNLHFTPKLIATHGVEYRVCLRFFGFIQNSFQTMKAALE